MARSIDFVAAKVYSDVCFSDPWAWRGANGVVRRTACVGVLVLTESELNDLILRSRAEHGVSKDGPIR
jgi:hypothetical protein